MRRPLDTGQNLETARERLATARREAGLEGDERVERMLEQIRGEVERAEECNDDHTEFFAEPSDWRAFLDEVDRLRRLGVAP